MKNHLLKITVLISAGFGLNAFAQDDIDMNKINSILPELDWADSADCEDDESCAPGDHWIPVWINNDCSQVVGKFRINQKFKIMDEVISCDRDPDYVGGPAITLGGVGNTLSLNGTRLECGHTSYIPALPLPNNGSTIGVHLFGFGNKLVGNHSESYGGNFGPRAEIVFCDYGVQIDKQIPTTVNTADLEADIEIAKAEGIRYVGNIVERVNVKDAYIGFNIQANNIYLADNDSSQNNCYYYNYYETCEDYYDFDETGSGFIVGNSAVCSFGDFACNGGPYEVKNILLEGNSASFNGRDGFVSFNQLNGSDNVTDISVTFRGNDSYENYDTGFHILGTGNNVSGRPFSKEDRNTAEFNYDGIRVYYPTTVTSPGGFLGVLNIISWNTFNNNEDTGIYLAYDVNSVYVAHNNAEDNYYYDYYDNHPDGMCASTRAMIATNNWWSNNARYLSSSTGYPACTLVSH